MRDALADSGIAASACSRETLQDSGIDLIPEVVAEAHGFAQSPVREDGLHFLVDVGAGTLDVCSFVLHRNQVGQDRYSILKAKVEPLGAQFYKQASAVERTRLNGEIEKTLHKAIWRTKTNRYPDAPQWRRGLPFLLCGGGMRVHPYREIPKILGPWFFRYLPDCRPNMIDVEAPPELILDPNARSIDYRRMAVAFGLSYPGTDIGRFEPPSSINNVPPPPRRDGGGNFVGPEQV